MKKITRKDFLKTLFCYTASGVGIMGMSRFTPQAAAQTVPAKSAPYTPPYLKLHRSGELKERAERLWHVMKRCSLCPRVCGTNRLAGYEGYCHSTKTLEISTFHSHMGEEKPLVGRTGSGTVYFTNCNLRCVFCLNWQANMEGKGKETSPESLASAMLNLQKKGCININLVTPTHYLPHILKALDLAAAEGLRIPMVYNTSGWELVDTLKELDGIIDVYLPDYKYSSSEMAAKYSADAASYPQITQKALLEMQRQVGKAIPNAEGIINRGLMVRHLVMPNNVSGTKEVLTWIGANLPKDTYVNLMSQYRPFYHAVDYSEINRRITEEEFNQAIQWTQDAGLTNVRVQRYIDAV